MFQPFILMDNNYKNKSDIVNNHIKEYLYKLRLIFEKEGLEIKNDNIEIDPGNFIIFFIKKLNSELNEKGSFLNRNKQRILSKEEQENEEIIRFKLLSKNYHFIPGNEHYYFNYQNLSSGK